MAVTTAAKQKTNQVEVNTSKEWRWAIGWALGALVLSAIPTLWGVLTAPSGGEFGGFLFYAQDGNTYLAKMVEGRNGAWAFSLAHTPEKTAEVFVYLPYLLLGKLAGLLNIPNLAMYHLARLVFGFGLLLAGYNFICLLFEGRDLRRLAFLLLCFSSGLGWLLFPLGIFSTDLWLAEGFTFLNFYANPHFALATLTLLLTFTWTLMGLEGRRRYYLAAAASSFVAGFVHPFLILTMATVLGVLWLRLAISEFIQKTGQGKKLAFDFVALIGVGIVGLPGPLIALISPTNDPALKVWLSQLIALSRGLYANALGYGLVFVLAIFGIYWVERNLILKIGPLKKIRTAPPDPTLSMAVAQPNLLRWRLVTTWALVTSVLIYLPFSFQRRLIEGWHIPLVCLATLGWAAIVWPWLQRRWKGLNFAKTNLALVAFCSLSTFVFIVAAIVVIYLPDEKLYDPARPPEMNAGEVGAFHWLQTNTKSEDIVISGMVLGNYIPAHTSNRVFYGHVIETVNEAEKFITLKRFFGATNKSAFVPMTNEERNGIIKRWSLKYLVYGWRERQMGDFDPAKTGWPLVYDYGDVQIYQLN